LAGRPTPAEVAALAVVLTALATGTDADRPSQPGAWSDLSLRLHRPLPAGPGAWRNSVWY